MQCINETQPDTPPPMKDASKEKRHEISTFCSKVPSAPLALKVNFRVNDSHMSRQSIVTTERLLFATVLASNLLLSAVVNGVLVPSEVIWSTEYGSAWLACTRVDAIALVWASLRIAGEQCG